MNNNITDEQLMNSILADQIPEAIDSVPDNEQSMNEETTNVDTPEHVGNPLEGKKLSFNPHDRSSLITDEIKQEDAERAQQHHITRAGENIFKNAEIREGWIPVNRDMMGLRSYFYPEDWQFRIRPANVEAIRNWSNVDETNYWAMDDILNEVLKSCLSIVTSQGQIPWGNIRSWDRLYFLLLIREYTFIEGEHKLKYDEDCPECDNPITFELTSNSLLYEYPDEDIIKYYDVEQCCWTIDPDEFGIQENTIKLYLPTLEKDANIKNWFIDRRQNQPNKKTEQAFIRFLPWLAPKFSKDLDVCKKQIKSLETMYKQWDMEMFTFVDEVIRNIQVTPKDKLIAKCEVCGEEVTAQIRFPNNIGDLFNVQNKHRKFGSK